MSFVDYFLIFLASACYAGLGRLFGGKSPFQSFIIAIVILSYLSGILAWTAPVFVIWVFRAAALIGGIILIVEGTKYLKQNNGISKLMTALDGRKIFAFGLFLIFAAYLFSGFHFRFIDFNAELMSYFGPGVETLKADYFGLLRLPTYLPYEYAAFPILNSTSMAAMIALLPEPNLVAICEARYIIMTAAFTRLAYLIWNKSGASLWTFMLSMISVTWLFHRDINSAIGGSSILYLVVLIEFVRTVIFNPERQTTIFVLGCGLALMYVPIILSAVILCAYLFLVHREVRINPTCWTIIALVIVHVAVLLSLPGIYQEESAPSLSFYVAHPFEPRPSIAFYRHALGRDPILYGVTALANHLPIALLTATGVIFMIFKYYIVGLAMIDRLRKWAVLKGPILASRALEVYFLASLTVLIFIRNGQLEGKYQFRAATVIAFVVGVLLLLGMLHEKGKKLRHTIYAIAILGVAATWYVRGPGALTPLPVAGYQSHEQTGVLYREVAGLSPEQLGNHPHRGIALLMQGKRALAEDITFDQSGIFRLLVNKPESLKR